MKKLCFKFLVLPGFLALLFACSTTPEYHNPDATHSDNPSERMVLKKYTIPNNGILQMQVPESWRESVTTYEHQQFYTLTFWPRTGDDFKVSVNVHAPGPRKRGPETEVSRQMFMEAMFRQILLPHCEEKEITSQKFSGAAGFGWFFSLTDTRIKAGERTPGQYRHQTYGNYLVNGDLLDLMIESYEKEDDTISQTLDMLKSAAKASK
jgi:hypothetical protein